MAGLQPDVGDVHVNALLTNMSIAYRNGQYVWDKIFPPVPVTKQSDIVPRFDKGNWLRNVAKVRGPGTLASRSGFTVDNTMTYFAKNWAIGKATPDEVLQNADEVYDMDMAGMEWVTDQINLALEYQVAAVAMLYTSWTSYVTGTTDFVKWDDYSASEPIKDIRKGIRTVHQLGVPRPNVVVMGEIVWDRLADNPDFLDRIKGAASAGNPAIVTKQLMASVLEVEEVVVGDAIRVSSGEAYTDTLTPIMDDDLLVLYRPPTPARMKPAGGYTFYWRPMTGGAPIYIRRYREEAERQTVIEAHSYFDPKVTSADAGYFFVDACD